MGSSVAVAGDAQLRQFLLQVLAVNAQMPGRCGAIAITLTGRELGLIGWRRPEKPARKARRIEC